MECAPSDCDLVSEPDPQRIAEKFLDLVRGAVDGKPMRVRVEREVYWVN